MSKELLTGYGRGVLVYCTNEQERTDHVAVLMPEHDGVAIQQRPVTRLTRLKKS